MIKVDTHSVKYNPKKLSQLKKKRMKNELIAQRNNKKYTNTCELPLLKCENEVEFMDIF